MIKIDNLNMKIGKKEILKNINLHVKNNEILAIIGPSGAGKSSLLRSINLIERPQSGTIKIDDLKLDFKRISTREAVKLRQKTAMVFQQHNLFINKNCKENLQEALIIVQKKSKAQAQEIAMECLKKVGLEDKADAFPYELSGGEAQRVGIARALALDSKIMLFDEPTSSLDLELVAEVLESIRAIQNKTMLIVTHELNFARAISHRIVFMCDGEILEICETKEFFERYSDEIEKGENLIGSKNSDSNNFKINRIRQFLAKMEHYKVYL